MQGEIPLGELTTPNVKSTWRFVKKRRKKQNGNPAPDCQFLGSRCQVPLCAKARAADHEKLRDRIALPMKGGKQRHGLHGAGRVEMFQAACPKCREAFAWNV